MSEQRLQVPVSWLVVGCVLSAFLGGISFSIALIWVLASQPEDQRFLSNSEVRFASSEATITKLTLEAKQCIGVLSITRYRDGRIVIPNSTLTQFFPNCGVGMTSVQFKQVTDGTEISFSFEGIPIRLVVGDTVKILEGTENVSGLSSL